MSRINRRKDEQRWARTAASVGDVLAAVAVKLVPLTPPPPPDPPPARVRGRGCARCGRLLKKNRRPQGGGKKRIYCSAACRVAAFRMREAREAREAALRAASRAARRPGLRDDQVVDLGTPIEVVETLWLD